VSNDITLISHPDVAFAGARRLFTAQDAFLLAITRTPLLCAARRLREEGWPSDTMIIIRDSADLAPDQAGRISDLLR
jgi:hypothetical protein